MHQNDQGAVTTAALLAVGKSEKAVAIVTFRQTTAFNLSWTTLFGASQKNTKAQTVLLRRIGARTESRPNCLSVRFFARIVML